MLLTIESAVNEDSPDRDTLDLPLRAALVIPPESRIRRGSVLDLLPAIELCARGKVVI